MLYILSIFAAQSVLKLWERLFALILAVDFKGFHTGIIDYNLFTYFTQL